MGMKRGRGTYVDPWDLENVAYIRRQSICQFQPFQPEPTSLSTSGVTGSEEEDSPVADVEEAAFSNPRYEPVDHYGLYVDMAPSPTSCGPSSFRPRSILTSLTDGDSYEDCEMGHSGSSDPDYQLLTSHNSTQTASWQFKSPQVWSNLDYVDYAGPNSIYYYPKQQFIPPVNLAKLPPRCFVDVPPLRGRPVKLASGKPPPLKKRSPEASPPPTASPEVMGYVCPRPPHIGLGKHGHMHIDYSLSWQRLDYYVSQVALNG